MEIYTTITEPKGQAETHCFIWIGVANFNVTHSLILLIILLNAMVHLPIRGNSMGTVMLGYDRMETPCD